MKYPLTARQSQILEWIKDFVKTNKTAPTLREIAESFGFASQNAAQQHVQALITKGWLGRYRNAGNSGSVGRTARGLVVL